MGKQVLTPGDRRAIIGAYSAGRTQCNLATDFNVCAKTIQRIIRKVEKFNSVERTKGSGRKRITTAAQDRAITLAVKRDRLNSLKDICQRLFLENVSIRTISRRLHEGSDFQSYWSVKKPFICERNRLKRIQWCRTHRHWTVEDWRKVIWSDESPFVVRFNGRFRVWRLHNERYNPMVTNATVKHSKKINVWGCFAAHAVGVLHKVEGILEQHQFNSILENQLLPSTEKLFPDGFYYFQQDNDPKHTSNMNKEWLADNIPHLLSWPAQSPDLNPIENLWSILDQRLKTRKVNTEAELLECLIEGWNALEPELLTRLIDSMPRRIEAVLKAKGYATKY